MSKIRSITADDELWQAVRMAALEDSIREGKTVGISEWVRRACREKLEDCSATPVTPVEQQ